MVLWSSGEVGDRLVRTEGSLATMSLTVRAPWLRISSLVKALVLKGVSNTSLLPNRPMRLPRATWPPA
jgi:hypothetical protein